MFFRSFFTGPGKHLQKVASPTVLNHAWRLLRKDPGCWERGLPVAEMERNVIRHVGELSRELLAGTYRPQPMRCYKVKTAAPARCCAACNAGGWTASSRSTRLSCYPFRPANWRRSCWIIWTSVPTASWSAA